MKNTMIGRLGQVNLLSLASIATEQFQDIDQIYQRTDGAPKSQVIRPGSSTVCSQIERLRGGDLMVIAIRDKDLKEVFCDEVIKHVGIFLSKPMVFFNLSEPNLSFTRWMIGDLTNIQPESGISESICLNFGTQMKREVSNLEKWFFLRQNESGQHQELMVGVVIVSNSVSNWKNRALEVNVCKRFKSTYPTK